MSGVVFEGVSKRFDDVVAVDDLSLQIADREFLVLLGPSGCGKSTALRMIAGLEEPTSGIIRIGDRVVNDLEPKDRDVAMVFQSYALYPHMTVRANIEFPLKSRHVDKAERAKIVLEAADSLGLGALLDRKPAQLSGGQRQRVALARAIVRRPEAFLMDEPLSNLDAKLRERLRIEIRELQRRLKITSVYVTHDQAEAMAISDRIVVMNQGRIEQIVDPVTIYRRPATAFTAEFIGQANIVEARVSSVGPRGCRLASSVGDLVAASQPDGARDRVFIAWRPEDMVPFEPGMANGISARIVNSIFMGNLTDVFIDVNGQSLRVQRPGAVPWRTGDTIVMSVPEDRIQILQ